MEHERSMCVVCCKPLNIFVAPPINKKPYDYIEGHCTKCWTKYIHGSTPTKSSWVLASNLKLKWKLKRLFAAAIYNLRRMTVT